MRNKIIILLSAIAFFSAKSASAFCPVCTIAVGACVGLSRWLGVDDAITGIWIGGLLVAVSAWTIDWMNKKNYLFKFYKIAVYAGYYILTIVPLYYAGIVGHPYNRLWGMDKLVLGIIFGSIFIFLGEEFHFFLKKRNGGKVYFPFQKVAFAILPLAILSAIFYYLTGC
jgi:hypothetical protein